MTLTQVPAATLVVAVGLRGTLRAQAPAQPSAGSVSVASGASEPHRGPARERPPGGRRTVRGSRGAAVWVMEGRTPAASTVSVFSVGARGTTLVTTTRIGRC